jgi:PAS domain S-box-containing protein
MRGADVTGVASILVVDDHAENRTALEALLAPLGQRVVAVGSGEAALKELLRSDFACILLDVQMPRLDGFQTAALIKRRERSQHIPIIFLTAASKDDLEVFRGYSAGAVDYIFKPIDPDVLRSKVAVFVELWQKTQQLREHEARLHEQELAALERASEARYRQLADAMPQIVWTADPDGEATYFNRRWFDYTGLSEDEAAAGAWQRVVHPDDLPLMLARNAEARRSGAGFEVEYRLRDRDGVYRWHLGRAVALRDGDGAVEAWIGTATDIHDRKRAEVQRSFLLAAGDALSQSLDYRETLSRVARLAVPAMADWCAVHVVEADGSVAELAVAHHEQAKVMLLRELQERYPPQLDGRTAPASVIRTGEPELVAPVPDELLGEIARDELHLDLLRQLGLHSYICVPLKGRDRILGAISLVAADSGRQFAEDDLLLAEELARRAATAIENAHLYRQLEERAQAARVLATIGDGVFVVGRGGRIRLWNQAAARITGLEPERVLGKPVNDAFPGWAERSRRLSVASAGGAAAPETVPLEIDGRELWLSISAVGFEEGTVYAFRDLTEERSLEALRQDLVATVSHELRTPLAAVYGAALTLQRSEAEIEPQTREELLRLIARESERLSSIIDDLLLASRLDAGRVVPNLEHCDPLSIVRAELDALRPRLPATIQLELEAPEELPPVAADAGQLRQVLANLLDNAVKYSPDGGRVTVAVEATARHVRFVVADTGLGIPPAEQRRIFEKFYRLDPHMARGIGGTGLGLYICRELLRRVDGRIWVESDGLHGSAFIVEVPVAAPPRKGSRQGRAVAVADS